MARKTPPPIGPVHRVPSFVGYPTSLDKAREADKEDAAIAGNGKSCGGRSGPLCSQPIPDEAVGSISYMTRTSMG